jgi:hypothetical protein
MGSEFRHLLVAVGAVAVSAAAGVAAFFAWVTRTHLCEANCHPSVPLEAQLIVALVGLVPVAVLLYAVAFGRKRLAACALVIGLAVYAAWGLLNNLAVHGSLLGG